MPFIADGRQSNSLRAVYEGAAAPRETISHTVMPLSSLGPVELRRSRRGSVYIRRNSGTGQKPDNAERLIRPVASMAPVVPGAAFSGAFRLTMLPPLITIVRCIARRRPDAAIFARRRGRRVLAARARARGHRHPSSRRRQPRYQKPPRSSIPRRGIGRIRGPARAPEDKTRARPPVIRIAVLRILRPQFSRIVFSRFIFASDSSDVAF